MMHEEKKWERALRYTEVVRPRVQPLATYSSTQLPYVCLSESLSDAKNAVVRRGKVEVEKPSLLLPSNHPQFDGFSMSDEQGSEIDTFMNFLLIRGVRFPSMKYNNTSFEIALHEGSLQNAVDYHLEVLRRQENLTSGLIVGKEDCWQYSVLIFVGMQMIKSADGDITRILEKNKYKNM